MARKKSSNNIKFLIIGLIGGVLIAHSCMSSISINKPKIEEEMAGEKLIETITDVAEVIHKKCYYLTKNQKDFEKCVYSALEK